MNLVTNLSKTKYFINCIIYAIGMGCPLAIRISLVFLLAMVFNVNDSTKFAAYANFTICADLSAILGSYISTNFLSGTRNSCICGFILCILGATSIISAIIKQDIFNFYIGLSYIGLGSGILRCNLMVIGSAYLKNDFTTHHNDYGSLMHFFTVIISFIIIFFTGSFLKIKPISVGIIALFLILISLTIFLIHEESSIKQEIKKLLLFKSRSIIKITYLLAIIIGAHISIFMLFKFSNINWVKNIPLVFFISFYAYLIKRFIQHHQERSAIGLAFVFGIVLIFYSSLERQRDTTLALFLQRNVNLKITNQLELTPLQVNSGFSLLIIIIGILFFKHKIHSKFNYKTIFLAINILLITSFTWLWLGCKFSQNSTVNLVFYFLSMFSMSFCNVLIYSKFIAVCRLMPEHLKSIISSFMIMNMGVAFYLARIYSSAMAIDQIDLNKAQTLAIYQDGFSKIIMICIGFLLFLFIANNIKSWQKLN